MDTVILLHRGNVQLGPEQSIIIKNKFNIGKPLVSLSQKTIFKIFYSYTMIRRLLKCAFGQKQSPQDLQLGQVFETGRSYTYMWW